MEKPARDTHLEGTEWHTLDQVGFPDAVIFSNNGSPLDGTYEIRRYIPEQRFQQLEQVAKEMLAEIRSCQNDCGWWHNAEDFGEQLEELGVDVDE